MCVCLGVGVGNFTRLQDRKVLRERIHVASLGMHAVLGTLSCFHIGFSVQGSGFRVYIITCMHVHIIYSSANGLSLCECGCAGIPATHLRMQ